MLQIIFIIVGVSFLINYLTFNKSINSLDYKLSSDTFITEVDEPFTLKSTIDNDKAMPVVYMETQLSFSESFAERYSQNNLYVGGYERIIITHHQKALQRGHHEVTSFKMILGDFLGFHRYTLRYPTHFEIFVKPVPMDLDMDLSPLDASYGDISVRRWIMEDPQMIIGIREYTGSEPLNRIHWPSSLKSGELYVKEFDFTSDRSANILLNMETSAPSWERPDSTSIERSISRCRSIVEAFEEESIPYGFACNAYSYENPRDRGYNVHPGLGEAHLNEVLLILARVDYKTSLRFFKLLEDAVLRASGNTYIIITPVVLEEYIDPLNLLSKLSQRVVLISEKNEFKAELSSQILQYKGAEK